jgi:hypothetical protein
VGAGVRASTFPWLACHSSAMCTKGRGVTRRVRMRLEGVAPPATQSIRVPAPVLRKVHHSCSDFVSTCSPQLVRLCVARYAQSAPRFPQAAE